MMNILTAVIAMCSIGATNQSAEGIRVKNDCQANMIKCLEKEQGGRSYMSDYDLKACMKAGAMTK